jgi:hypothetical protein
MYEPGGQRRFAGVECVIDKDLASELLARELGADVFVMLSDVDAVYVDWGTPAQRAIRRASPDALERLSFAAGSMGAKVQAACRFAQATGRTAAIGALADVERIIAGDGGHLRVPRRARHCLRRVRMPLVPPSSHGLPVNPCRETPRSLSVWRLRALSPDPHGPPRPARDA